MIRLVQELGPHKWTYIATHLPGRIGKQCRERWHNHLNPQIKKTAWSDEEEWVLYLYHRAIGNKWAEIAKNIIGRTDNSIKNHWNSGMKRRYQEFQVKLEQVHRQFEVEGAHFFDHLASEAQRKPLEIILLNKKYVCSEDPQEDEMTSDSRGGQNVPDANQENDINKLNGINKLNCVHAPAKDHLTEQAKI